MGRNRSDRRRARGAGAVAAGVLVAVGAGWLGGASSSPTAAPAAVPPSASALQSAYVSILRSTVPSVVAIESASGLGSGVVFDRAGDVVTNAHVVGTATRFAVTLSSGRTLAATLVGTYVPDDLAVIRLAKPAAARPATFGDSSALRAGDITLAIGNPLGLSSSVTDGIVSYSGRTVSEGNGVVLADMIQTSAAINPGNSGGALVDLAGKVIGIPTLAAATSSSSAAAGIGFAIPSKTVELIAPQLIAHGKVTSAGRAALGVEIAGVVDSSGSPAGVAVLSVVVGGPAAKAGIRSGELVTAVGGNATPDPSEFGIVLARYRPGQVVTVTVWSATGARRSVQVTLGDLASVG